MNIFLKNLRYALLFIVTSNVAAMAEQDVDLTGVGYDQHVELKWTDLPDLKTQYRIKLSVNGGDWIDRAQLSEPYLLDYVGEFGNGLKLVYRLYSLSNGTEDFLEEVALTTRPFSDDELLEMTQKYTFRYFWEFADEKTGWAIERKPEGESVTSGGTGFGVMAIITAVERGWISRQEAVTRVLKITDSAKGFEKFHGMFAHWYNIDGGDVFHFSEYDDGGDIVETAFLAQGLLAARQYFNNNNDDEIRLRSDIMQLWEAMEWNWYTRSENILYWHWSKNHVWAMNQPIEGYNEALIVYVLAAASPKHSIADTVYHKGWARPENKHFYNGKTYYGIPLPLGSPDEMGGPLFFAHYSFLGLDPRGLSDKYANYWEESKNLSLISRAYSIDNPKGWKGYGDDFWGLTAGDMVPKGYTAHAPGERDFGTINPTGALSSIAYTPDASIAVLRNLYYNHGKEFFGPYGFYDGINLSVSDNPSKQISKTYLAINQGPIIVMMENYRSGLLWKYFMQDPDVRKGLDKLGFKINGQKITSETPKH